MTRTTILAIAMLPLAWGPAAAQQSASLAQRIEAAITRAGDAGIPSALLANRILEGATKGLAREQLAQAIEQMDAPSTSQKVWAQGGTPMSSNQGEC